ncbi:tetratricopeptide repeat protein [Paludibacterium paludis]|nr:tetratricopeptide repeat protein [Paludibacterium paludis]
MDLSILDADEIFQLALNLVSDNQHAEAIALLKDGATRYRSDARLHYLLGAEYAQIGLYDRAAESLETAAALDPSLHMAVFQLGLLRLTQGQPDKAISAWKGLDGLEDTSALPHFRKGLEHLIADEFDACRDSLKKGMEINTALPALNHDMQQILDRVDAASAPQPAAAEEAQPAPATGSLFMRGYAGHDDSTRH